MERFFQVIKLLEKQTEINNFEQGDAESQKRYWNQVIGVTNIVL